MKRTERVGAMIQILTGSPSKTYSLQYFCDLFGAAKIQRQRRYKGGQQRPFIYRPRQA